MTQLIKKIHIYLALACLSALLVYAIAGLWVFSFVRPADRPRPAPEVSFLDFTAPANADDREAARLLWTAVNAPMTPPPHPTGIRRDSQHNLAFAIYSVNGLWRITYLEAEKRARVERQPNPLGGFFMALHEMALRYGSPDPRSTLWKFYNEFAMWSLILMVITGVWLWLASRPGYLWARISFALGAGGFLVLFTLAR